MRFSSTPSPGSRRTSAALRSVVWLLIAMVSTASVALAKGGMAVDGEDTARMLTPGGAPVESYRNAGYELVHENGEARVTVRLGPLESRSPFRPPTKEDVADDAVARVSRAVVLGSATEYEAVSRILAWTARNIEYRLDREESQAAEDVLRRRSGYCTGIARLAVALLRSVGLEAREVAGFVYGDGIDGPQGFHRWIETRLSDVGWVYSDPLYSHHYVPAGYLRLAGERVAPQKGMDGLLLERRDEIRVVDLSPSAGPGIRIRRNTDRRLAAALQISVESGEPGLAVLEGRSNRFRHQLVAGETTFLGLEPGSYRLRVMLSGRGIVERRVEVVGRQRTTIILAASQPSQPTAPPGADPTLGGLE